MIYNVPLPRVNHDFANYIAYTVTVNHTPLNIKIKVYTHTHTHTHTHKYEFE